MSALGTLLRNENNFDFISLWKRTMVISGILTLVAVGALTFRGLNLGIEFEGGASWEVRSSEVTAAQLESALEPLGLGNARIQRVANELWRVRAATESSAALQEVKVALADAADIDPSEVTASAVGASWGNEVTAKARTALIFFFIVLFIYISLRLEWKMGAAALLAVAHDILVTTGIYALFQFEVTSATVIAFLTILGYSLYDTLVVFDKVRENERRSTGAVAMTYSEVTSFSLNQVLMRCLNATVTSVLPVLTVLIVGRFILGAVTLQEFAVALLIGLIVGAYSSLFVATPIVAFLKEREAVNVERQVAATKRAEGDFDVSAALVEADRSRKVRSSARGDGHRVTAGSRTVTAPKVTVTKRRNDGSSPKDSAADRAPKGEIKPRPRKNKRCLASSEPHMTTPDEVIGA